MTNAHTHPTPQPEDFDLDAELADTDAWDAVSYTHLTLPTN